MEKRKIYILALIFAVIITIPEIPSIIAYIKSPKELGEMLLAFLVRYAMWIIGIRVVLFLFGLIKKLIGKK